MCWRVGVLFLDIQGITPSLKIILCYPHCWTEAEKINVYVVVRTDERIKIEIRNLHLSGLSEVT